VSDRFRPLGAGRLAAWVAGELEVSGSIFGIPRELWFAPSGADRFAIDLRGRRIETPIGVAAGPHTQLAQNIVVAWLCGARVIELKTVQTLDRIEVAKPCIDMRDAGYNIEWSQELGIRESFHEYLTAWILIHSLHARFGFPGDEPGVLFDLSVGYDLEGIKRPNMQWFLDHAADAGDELGRCVDEVARWFPEAADLEIPSRLADSVTLSTLHGCPPDEIGVIAEYLMASRGLHTSVKLNPTLIGYDTVHEILVDDLGWADVEPQRSAFDADLGYRDAVTLLAGLTACAAGRNLEFGVKLCNTLPVTNSRPDFDPAEPTAYLSGRPLHALAVELARRLRREFGGGLPISFAGGADAFSTPALLAAGLRPVTTCSDILRPGGYLRLRQYLEEIDAALDRHGAGNLDELTLITAGIDGPVAEAARLNLERYADSVRNDPGLMRATHRRDRTKTGRTLGLFDCVEAPCTDACAVDQKVPEYMRRVAASDIDGAAATIAQDNPLPSILGRACHHPCEPVCLRTHLDQPLAIREIKRFVSDHARAGAPTGPVRLGDLKVAVVGAGPCGLAAAADLARAGVDAVIYEARPEGGGMVSATIPGYRASADAVRRDLDAIAALGPTMEFGVQIGRDLGLDDLFSRGFDFVVVATGAQRGLPLGIDGEDAAGVLDGLDFLRAARRRLPIDLGRRIAVVGGGDVAMDCARTARRLIGGAVEILYRRTVDEMPAHPEEISDLLAEGITIRELVAPRRIITVDGALAGLDCVRMRLAEPDESGRPRPVEAPGERVTIEVDTLIVAIGQRADLGIFGKTLVACSPKGYLEVDPETLETSIPRVYAGGDLRDPGPSNIVDACGDGRRIAGAILDREGLTAPDPAPTDRPELDLPGLLRRRSHREDRVEIPRVPSADRGAFDEVVATLEPEAATIEARRCLDCDLLCSTCEGVCPNRAIATYFLEPLGELPTLHGAARQTPQVAVMADLCNECGNCATFCPTMGRPWRDKPRIYFDRGAFEAEDDNAFMLLRINGRPAIQGRFRGVTRQLTFRSSTAEAAIQDTGHSERAKRVEESRTDADGKAFIAPSGDPSTDSSNSFAQGDGRGGDSETFGNVLDPESAVMFTLLRGLTRSMPHLPMSEASAEWLVSSR